MLSILRQKKSILPQLGKAPLKKYLQALIDLAPIPRNQDGPVAHEEEEEEEAEKESRVRTGKSSARSSRGGAGRKASSSATAARPAASVDASPSLEGGKASRAGATSATRRRRDGPVSAGLQRKRRRAAAVQWRQPSG